MRPEVALPIIIPLLAGAFALLCWRSPSIQRITGVLGSLAMLVSAGVLLEQVWSEGILVLQMGSWPAPFGISLVADLLAAIMVTMTGIVAVCTAIYSLATINDEYTHYGYYPLMFLLLAGVNGAFLTGDIFNLYVWFEVMLVASFALLILGGERKQMEGAIKYVTINLLSSALFLTAIGLIYGTMGTLNFADLGQKIAAAEDNGLLEVVALLLLISFGIKAGVFPLFFWLPASYHTPRVAVSALFAGLLTKVGVYVIYRVFTVVFPLRETGFIEPLLMWMAATTMIIGGLGAAAQFEFRRILSFHIISQIGYMIMGLALLTPLALIGGIFFIAHNIIVKANLFLISGLVFRLKGSHDLALLGGLYRSQPLIALLFLVTALSLAGIPPLSGFFAKFTVIKSGVLVEHWWLVAAALVAGFLTLFSMIKIWVEVFWKDQTDDAVAQLKPRHGQGTSLMILSITLLAIMTTLMGLGAEPLYRLFEAAAHQLLDPQGYIAAVLGGDA